MLLVVKTPQASLSMPHKLNLNSYVLPCCLLSPYYIIHMKLLTGAKNPHPKVIPLIPKS